MSTRLQVRVDDFEPTTAGEPDTRAIEITIPMSAFRDGLRTLYGLKDLLDDNSLPLAARLLALAGSVTGHA